MVKSWEECSPLLQVSNAALLLIVVYDVSNITTSISIICEDEIDQRNIPAATSQLRLLLVIKLVTPVV